MTLASRQVLNPAQEAHGCSIPCPKPCAPAMEEARPLLAQMRGPKWLMASLLYGAGLRLMECLRLRVKNVEVMH